MDFEVTRAIRQTKIGSLRNMMDRSAFRFSIKPHVPVFDKSYWTVGKFPRSDFTSHVDQNSYTCPKDKSLRTNGTVHDGETRLYHSSKSDCDSFPLKSKKCPKASDREIPRNIYEDARDIARSVTKTREQEASCRTKEKVEMLFAHLKRILKLVRVRLPGPSGAQDKFLPAAIAQNLRKLAKLRYKPPPDITNTHLESA